MLLDAQQLHLQNPITLKLPCDVRWGTNHRLLADVIDSKGTILEVLQSPTIRGKRALKTEARRLEDEFSDLDRFSAMRLKNPMFSGEVANVRSLI